MGFLRGGHQEGAVHGSRQGGRYGGRGGGAFYTFTAQPQNVDHHSADLVCTVQGLGENDYADVYFSWRRVNPDSDWHLLSPIRTYSVGDVVYPLGRLWWDQEYEYKTYVVGEPTEDLQNNGTVSFTTQAYQTAITDLPRMKLHNWYVEIEHPDGTTIEPTIVGRPTRIPAVNSFPEIRVPVRRQDRWTLNDFEDQPMRVWYKGEQQPIETLKDVTHESGNTVLVGRGGLDLESRATEEYTSKTVHDVATDLINSYTSYTANVDQPPSDVKQNATLRTTSTTTEWNENFPAASDEPIRANNGDLEAARTAWMYDNDFLTVVNNNIGAIGEVSETNDSGEFDIGGYGGTFCSTSDDETFFFTPDYDIPAGALGFAMRVYYQDDREWYQNGPKFAVTVYGGSGGEDLMAYAEGFGVYESTKTWLWEKASDTYSSEIPAGTTVQVTFDAQSSGTTQSGTDTVTASIGSYVQIANTNIDDGTFTATDSGGTTLTEGTDYTLKPLVGKIKFLSDGSVSDGENIDLSYDYWWDIYYFDAMVAYDTRFNYTWDETDSDSNGNIGGPQPFPDAAVVESDSITPVRSVVGARIEGTTPDSSGVQEIAASNDGGGSYPITGSSFPLEGDFSDNGGALRTRLTLQRYGTSSSDNQYYVDQGIERPVINDVTEKADLDSGPTLVLNETFDEQVINVLQRLSDRGDYVFEFQWDENGKSIEMAKFGSRASESDLSLSDYSTTKSTQNVIQEATIKGASEDVDGEKWTANSGAWVDLEHDFLVTNSEKVYDSNDKVYIRNADYEIDYQGGQLKMLSGGDLTDGNTYSVDYDRKYHDTYTADGVTDPREVVRELPILVSDRACGQAAVSVVEKLKNPVESATLTFPADELGFTVIDELYVPGLPTEQQRFQVQNIEAGSGTVTVELGRPETLSDLLSDINSRVHAASTRL